MNPEVPWATTKAIKSVGFAVAGEIVRALATDNPFKAAWTPLSTLISTLQTIIDLGDATGELVSMKLLLDQAKEVQAEYGTRMRFYDENEAKITTALQIFDQMAMASQTLDTALSEAQSKLDTIDPASFYWSV